VFRGAGSRNSRQVTDALDHLGLQRSSSVGVYHTRFSCAGLAQQVIQGLAIYTDIVRRPHLPDDGFTGARDLALQALSGLEDEPQRKLMINLREWHFPDPLGRNSMGNRQALEAMAVHDCRQDLRSRYQAQGSILAVAGRIDARQVCDEVERHLGDWNGDGERPIHLTPPPGRVHHQPQQSEQTHIGVAYPSVPETDERYYAARMGVEVLSGGSSGRLFTEVREKRGLCYSVWAGYSGLKGLGSIMGYAGTSNDRAQATLDTLLDELRRLSAGVQADELERAKTGLKAATIMQDESTSARAGAMAHDYFIRGRIRTLDEIKASIDAVTVQCVNDYLAANRPGPFTIVTVGPKELALPG
jgi:predicted Zn-dependent peptidase